MARKSGDRQLAITSVLEWISAAMGLLLAFAIFGVIGWQAMRGSDKAPPALHASVVNLVRTGNSYVVEVKVRNTSNSTAAGVLVQGELMHGGTAIETSEMTMDYVPAQSKRSAGLIFSRDPRKFDLVVRPLGYERP